MQTNIHMNLDVYSCCQQCSWSKFMSVGAVISSTFSSAPTGGIEVKTWDLTSIPGVTVIFCAVFKGVLSAVFFYLHFREKNHSKLLWPQMEIQPLEKKVNLPALRRTSSRTKTESGYCAPSPRASTENIGWPTLLTNSYCFLHRGRQVLLGFSQAWHGLGWTVLQRRQK